MDPVVLTKAADVEAALLDPLLVPPAALDVLRPGPTHDLRTGMARFSATENHAHRRLAVDRTIAGLADQRFAAEAERRTTAIVASAAHELDASADIGFIVPCETMAAALGVADETLELVRGQVRAVTEVIGRGQPSSQAADEAATELIERLSQLGHDPVAAVSLLYQTHDATAALFSATLIANQTGTRRQPAVAATMRTATRSTAIGDTTIASGQTVVVDLETARFEFGLGPHRCPGTQIASQLVAGMVQALDDAGLALDIDFVQRPPAGPPPTLPLIPRG